MVQSIKYALEQKSLMEKSAHIAIYCLLLLLLLSLSSYKLHLDSAPISYNIVDLQEGLRHFDLYEQLPSEEDCSANT